MPGFLGVAQHLELALNVAVFLGQWIQPPGYQSAA